MANHGENLMEWLRHAHAMEQQAEQALRDQAERIVNYPNFKARVEQHLHATLRQQQLLDGCISRLGGKTSGFKDALGKVVAFGQGARGALHLDEVLKTAISRYAFGNLEIATYTSLVAAAKTIGDAETQQVCERILGEEQAMATWMLRYLPELTETFLLRDAAGLDAKN